MRGMHMEATILRSAHADPPPLHYNPRSLDFGVPHSPGTIQRGRLGNLEAAAGVREGRPEASILRLPGQYEEAKLILAGAAQCAARGTLDLQGAHGARWPHEPPVARHQGQRTFLGLPAGTFEQQRCAPPGECLEVQFAEAVPALGAVRQAHAEGPRERRHALDDANHLPAQARRTEQHSDTACPRFQLIAVIATPFSVRQPHLDGCSRGARGSGPLSRLLGTDSCLDNDTQGPR
mmetsp:Transcript_106034/g.342217  ORF Transcript_106034/g.342217 Transcript_106034/m.342217 type:complete len:235 (+) Transcript_106034:4048-4752(+)